MRFSHNRLVAIWYKLTEEVLEADTVMLFRNNLDKDLNMKDVYTDLMQAIGIRMDGHLASMDELGWKASFVLYDTVTL